MQVTYPFLSASLLRIYSENILSSLFINVDLLGFFTLTNISKNKEKKEKVTKKKEKKSYAKKRKLI